MNLISYVYAVKPIYILKLFRNLHDIHNKYIANLLFSYINCSVNGTVCLTVVIYIVLLEMNVFN